MAKSTTHFRFVDKKTNNIIWDDPYSECFGEWVPVDFDDKEEGFAPGRKMILTPIMADFNTKFYSHEKREQLAREFVEFVNNLFGYHITFRVDNIGVLMDDWNDNGEYKTKTCFIFELDCDEFTSKHELKLAAYLMRYTWDYDMIYYVENLLNEKEIGFISSWLKTARIKETKKERGYDFEYPYPYSKMAEYDLTKNYDQEFLAWHEKNIKNQPYDANDTLNKLNSFFLSIPKLPKSTTIAQIKPVESVKPKVLNWRDMLKEQGKKILSA